jgi:hypothetical protein
MGRLGEFLQRWFGGGGRPPRSAPGGASRASDESGSRPGSSADSQPKGAPANRDSPPDPALARLAETLKRHDVDPSTLGRLAQVEDAVLYHLTTPGKDAVALWRRLHDLVAETGYWPLLLGDANDPDGARQMVESMEECDGEFTLRQVIEKGLALDVPPWLAERLEEASVSLDEDATEDAGPEAGGSGSDAGDSFMIPRDILTGKPHRAVSVALVPTTTPWEVPAYLRFGGWNECPRDYEHVAVMKRWHDTYGAVPIGMTFDVVEMYVPRPPRDWKAALALAREQYAYCADIVDQGTQSVARLAQTLMGSSVWYFWWD